MTKAYVATRMGGDFAVIDVSSPKPKPGEVSIRNKAVALNPGEHHSSPLTGPRLSCFGMF